LIRSAVFVVLCAFLVADTQSAGAQTSGGLQFEVASVRQTPPFKGGANMQGCRGGPDLGNQDPLRFSCVAIRLWNLVGMAYRTPSYRLDGPGWLKDSLDMFDVTANIPEKTTRDEFYAMLQNLLTERFHLVVHHESREIEQYDLVVAKNGPKFKEAPAPGALSDTSALTKNGCPALPKGVLQGSVNGQMVMYRPASSVGVLADSISAQVKKPVRDITGLTGRYEVALCWIPDGSTDPGPTLMDALQDQLGLRLESHKTPVDFVVVDSVDKSPIQN
jgi:uncharacterized protein (TIGR03435 family)